MPNYVITSFVATSDELDRMRARLQPHVDGVIASISGAAGQFTLQTSDGDGHTLAATLRRLADQLDDLQTDHDATSELVVA